MSINSSQSIISDNALLISTLPLFIPQSNIDPFLRYQQVENADRDELKNHIADMNTF